MAREHEPFEESLVSRITTSVAHRSGAVVLSVAGDVDLSTSVKLEAAIDEVLSKRPSIFIVDLSEVEFLASVGLRLLTAAHEMAEIPGRFGVVADNPATRRPIQVTDLDKVFALFPTVDSAMRSLGDAAHS